MAEAAREFADGCFIIGTNRIDENKHDITLDCQGNAIIGPPGREVNIGWGGHSSPSGVYIYGASSNITVKNCTIKSFAYGLQAYGDQLVIRHNNLTDNHTGILFTPTNTISFIDNQSCENRTPDGIHGGDLICQVIGNNAEQVRISGSGNHFHTLVGCEPTSFPSDFYSDCED